MIKKNNFKDVLKKLGFEPINGVYIKNHTIFNAELKVDFENEKFGYYLINVADNKKQAILEEYLS